MKCPLCNTEMRIKGSSYVQKDGAIYLKQVLTCRKKDCPNFGKNVTSVYSPLGNIVEDPEAPEQEEAE